MHEGQNKLSYWDIHLADFGYSRFYIEQDKEGDFTKKNIDMESLAGTPVFMTLEVRFSALGDAIAFTRQGRNTNYVRELPPEVDDILTPVFKDRQTWLLKKCHAVDLVQTKIRLVSVHSGLESKIPYGESSLLLSHLRSVIQSDFKINSDNLFKLRDSSQTDSSISDQSALDVSYINYPIISSIHS